MLVMALLSAVVWAWAMRKSPPVPATTSEESPPEEPQPLHYVAIGNTNINTLFESKQGSSGEGWAERLHTLLPAGTLYSSLGANDRTLNEVNANAVPEAVKAKPDIVTLWQVVGDSTSGTSLSAYVSELKKALERLTRETEAQVVLLNLPDVTLLMDDQGEERRAMIRGGIEQWNRVIAEAASRYGRRVLLIDLYPISAQILVLSSGNGKLADAAWQELEGAVQL